MSLRDRLAIGIGRIADLASRGLAPAMPWIFLCFRHALIPTLCWVALALLFFVVPQSREVLHGLSEPPLQSIFDFQGELARLVNVWALVSYVATSVLLALGLWYSARLLSTVESAHATPRALIGGRGEVRLAFATTWLPRILGCSALAASVGAMVYANYTPQLSQLRALALAVAAVVGPVLAVAASLSAEGSGRVRQWLLYGAGVALVLAATWLLHAHADKWRVWLWCAGASVLPAALLAFLVQRRSLMARLKMDAGGAAHLARRFGDVVVTLILIVAGAALALLLLAFSPSFVVRRFGSASSLLLFMASAVLLCTAAQLVLRRIARDVPGLTTAALALIAVLVAAIGKEALGTEALDPAPPAAAAPAVERPSGESAPAANGPERRVYINAYGGGLRAAVFTAELLAQADDATCGEFGPQLAAVSGVSGGSLGLATYLVARQEHVARGGWADCQRGQKGATPLTDLVTKTLVQDHLSPAIARMLAIDAPHLPGSPVRGQALLESWQSAIAEALSARQPAGAAKPPGFALRLGRLTGGLVPPVQAYFNATNADTGHILWFSNQAKGLAGDNLGGAVTEVGEMTVGQAVLHSARFPIVSPAGAFRPAGAPASARLIDGGYADNSGTTTLLHAFQARPLAASGQTPVFIDIDGNPPDESICYSTSGTPPLLTGVRGLLQARAAHATLAVKHLSEAMHMAPLLVRIDLEQVYGVLPGPQARDSPACEKVRRAQQAPLGWYVSYGAATTIALSAQFGVDRVIAALGTSPRQEMPRLSATAK